ncbi:hypothetical protein MRB53_027598 [Persea americana]|uniref:Uncharacterized protein n=1 Tax=Persea americana TaxID=3435 RepID=A0ACC2LMD8_PERAE|nr:hypothetical protein MRB53_027598 [Persea americana]
MIGKEQSIARGDMKRVIVTLPCWKANREVKLYTLHFTLAFFKAHEFVMRSSCDIYSVGEKEWAATDQRSPPFTDNVALDDGVQRQQKQNLHRYIIDQIFYTCYSSLLCRSYFNDIVLV